MINSLTRQLPFVDENGKMLEQPYQWMLGVTNLQVIVGNGSPEGVITAQQTKFYLQLDGAARNILWIKKLSDIGGDRSTGWELV